MPQPKLDELLLELELEPDEPPLLDAEEEPLELLLEREEPLEPDELPELELDAELPLLAPEEVELLDELLLELEELPLELDELLDELPELAEDELELELLEPAASGTTEK